MLFDESFQRLEKAITERLSKSELSLHNHLIYLYWELGRQINTEISLLGVTESEFFDGIREKLKNRFGLLFEAKILTFSTRLAQDFPRKKELVLILKWLNWSHFKEVLALENSLVRQYYLVQAASAGWTKKTLKKAIVKDSFSSENPAKINIPQSIAYLQKTADSGVLPQRQFEDLLEPQLQELTRLINKEHDFERFFSVEELNSTWRDLRKVLKNRDTRDVIDYFDWDTQSKWELTALNKDICENRYLPGPSKVYEAPKSKGAFRRLVTLDVRDGIVYRRIADEIYNRAKRTEHDGVFFSRRFPPPEPLRSEGELAEGSEGGYSTTSSTWRRIYEFRKQTLLQSTTKVVVLTDIGNYFDSIHHDLLIETLSPLGLPRNVLGQLSRILHAYKPTADFTVGPPVGIPTDDIECSRQLAHVFLFDHDSKMINAVGTGNYVRWMDDQNFSASTEVQARKIINNATRSLAAQRLTLNSEKTTFLSRRRALSYFQIDANIELQKWKEQYFDSSDNLTGELLLAKKSLNQLWKKLSKRSSANRGHWSKILEIFYKSAGLVKSDFLEEHCLEHLIEWPLLARSIFEYLGCMNKGSKLIELFKMYCSKGHNLFESTESLFFDEVMLLDCLNKTEETYLKQLAKKFAIGESKWCTGRGVGKSSAILAMYWFGASLEELREVFDYNSVLEAGRAWLACCAAKDLTQLDDYAAYLVGKSTSEMTTLHRFLRKLANGEIDSYDKNYRAPRRRHNKAYLDPRSWLLLDLGSQSKSQNLSTQLRNDIKYFQQYRRSTSEESIISRVEERL